jgi:acid phosphatase
VALALAVGAMLGGCGAGNEPVASRESRSLHVPPAQPRPVTKLLVFVVENHSLRQMRTGMSYTARLARRYGYAVDYHAIGHPSLPNYLAIASGRTHGVRDDLPPSSHPLRGRTVFGQALALGRTAKVYAEGMPSRCALVDGGHLYAARHNPWTYFVQERSQCRLHDVAMTEFARDVDRGRLPNAGLAIPNMCNDAHDCSLSTADDWLRNRLSRVWHGPDWRSGHLAVVITADEDDYSQGNRVLTVVVHPSQHSHVVRSPLTQYSLTRLYEDVLRAGHLGRAARAPSMTRAFGLPTRG